MCIKTLMVINSLPVYPRKLIALLKNIFISLVWIYCCLLNENQSCKSWHWDIGRIIVQSGMTLCHYDDHRGILSKVSHKLCQTKKNSNLVNPHQAMNRNQQSLLRPIHSQNVPNQEKKSETFLKYRGKSTKLALRSMCMSNQFYSQYKW